MRRESEAVVLFLGRDRSPIPEKNPGLLADRFGAVDGARLVRYVEGILQELDAIGGNQNIDTLQDATADAVSRIASAHPELSTQALQALGWAYSYGWK